MRSSFLRLGSEKRIHGSIVRGIDRPDAHVFPGDLGATLEAHRAQNLARRIRKIEPRPAPPRDTEPLDKSEAHTHTKQRSAPPSEPPYPNRIPLLGRQNLPSGARHCPNDSSTNDLVSQDPDALGNRQRRHAKENRLAALAIGNYVKPLLYRDRARYAPYVTHGLLELGIDGHQKLDRLLCSFEQWIQLDEDEIGARHMLLHAVTNQLQTYALDANLRPFGSIVTGLATPISDMDVALEIDQSLAGTLNSLQLRVSRVEKLRLLQNYIYKHPPLKDPHIVKSTRVPVLRFMHGPSNLQLQVVPSLDGIDKVDLIRGWLEEFPYMRPIYFIVKTTLAVRGLSEPKEGGLGSYTLLCMILGFFRMAGHSRRDSLCATLCDFLEFYGHFNTRYYCISVRPPRMFKKRTRYEMKQVDRVEDAGGEDEVVRWHRKMSIVHETKPWLLCIQDPSDWSNDLGKVTERIMDIRMTFRVLAQRLRSWLDGTKERQTENPLIPFFGFMLGRIRDERRHFRRWASTPGHRRPVLSPPPTKSGQRGKPQFKGSVKLPAPSAVASSRKTAGAAMSVNEPTMTGHG